MRAFLLLFRRVSLIQRGGCILHFCIGSLFHTGVFLRVRCRGLRINVYRTNMLYLRWRGKQSNGVSPTIRALSLSLA